jgi:general secretion pathway protein G
MKNLFKKNKGFTLIELLIVVGIIGILATLLMANFIGVRQRARDAQRKSDIRQIQSALEIYRSDISSYPATLYPTNCPTSGALQGGSPANTYMSKIPCDPSTSTNYSYTQTGSGTGYTLIVCLENSNDPQKDASNNSAVCSGSYSYTLQNP